VYGTRVAWFSTWNKNYKVDKNLNKVVFKIYNFNLAPGEYDCNLFIGFDNEVADFVQNANNFSVNDFDYYLTGKVLPQNQGYILFNYDVFQNRF
jgi:lipopolysaccharide transport system ATP-binding protein